MSYLYRLSDGGMNSVVSVMPPEAILSRNGLAVAPEKGENQQWDAATRSWVAGPAPKPTATLNASQADSQTTLSLSIPGVTGEVTVPFDRLDQAGAITQRGAFWVTFDMAAGSASATVSLPSGCYGVGPATSEEYDFIDYRFIVTI